MDFVAAQVAARYQVAKSFLVKNPHKELKGETIEVSKIPQYEREVKRLAAEYRKAKAALDKLPSGKAKGMAGHKLSKIGEEGRKARMRLEVAKSMKAKNLNKATF